MFSVLTVAMLTVAQPVAPKPPQAPPVAIEKIAKPKVAKAYADFRAEAIAAGKPIVIFVRCEPRPVAGAVLCRVDHLDGYDSGPNIVIGMPDSRVGMRWKATLERDATDAQIRREIGGTQTRLPFFRLRASIADDSQSSDRQLPDWFPREAERYSSAKWTQVAYKTATGTTPHNTVHAFGDGGRIDKWPISLLDTKWQSPGGLEFAHGWKSERYKYLPSPAVEGVTNATLANGVLVSDDKSGSQVERIITRKYADGSWFADVLRNNDGDIFEIRIAEKEDGAWKRYVAFRDAANRPRGYSPVMANACARCHDQAGAGSYASARIPGGDGVLSDPIARLEN